VVAWAAAAAPLDLVFHIGDLSYAVGYMAVWDLFLAMIEVRAGAATSVVSCSSLRF
jgi:hypothetical protein